MMPAELRRWRFYAEALNEQAITILDAFDGDADLEDGGEDEPSFASPVGGKVSSLGLPVAMMTGSIPGNPLAPADARQAASSLYHGRAP